MHPQAGEVVLQQGAELLEHRRRQIDLEQISENPRLAILVAGILERPVGDRERIPQGVPPATGDLVLARDGDAVRRCA